MDVGDLPGPPPPPGERAAAERRRARKALAEQLIVAWVRSGSHRMVKEHDRHALVALSAFDLAEAFCVEAEKRAAKESEG